MYGYVHEYITQWYSSLGIFWAICLENKLHLVGIVIVTFLILD